MLFLLEIDRIQELDGMQLVIGILMENRGLNVNGERDQKFGAVIILCPINGKTVPTQQSTGFADKPILMNL
jgi:hypothetical protein